MVGEDGVVVAALVVAVTVLRSSAVDGFDLFGGDGGIGLLEVGGDGACGSDCWR